MKYKLLSVNKDSLAEINIGDYIQALAALQYLPSFDGFVNREELSRYDGEECAVIMNGWFMHSPENWPPSKMIHPIFLSFHIDMEVSEEMLSARNLKYFKENEPIGCRDYYTCNLLMQKGIDSWFSGCLTLSLGKGFLSNEKRNTVYFVDPYMPDPCSKWDRLKNLLVFFSSPLAVYRLSKKISVFYSYKGVRDRIERPSQFFRVYSKVFTTNCLVTATYITHSKSIYKTMSDKERMNEAKALVEKYANGKFVVTSRLHCALPCLGLHTPVYFIQNNKWNDVFCCRFGGLIDLFNTVIISSNQIICNFEHKGKLSETSIVKNKNTWEPLAKAISIRCREQINHIE